MLNVLQFECIPRALLQIIIQIQERKKRNSQFTVPDFFRHVIGNTGIIFSGLKKVEVFNILILLQIQKIFLKMGHNSDQGGCSCRPGWDNYRLDPKFSDTNSFAENHP